MKIAGVIAEYNPLHSGHAYHLRQTRRLTGCDWIVVCMAGNYTQRGEAACLSKWERAQMVLNCGADAVFELPALFAVRPADAFALGGVSVLNALGVDVLSFGCEDETLPARIAKLRAEEPAEVTNALRQNLALGMSHARAWGAAAAQALDVSSECLNAPNVVLAAEYLRAIAALNSTMEWLAVRRIGGYHDSSMDGAFASATAIRQAIRAGALDQALPHVPEAAREILARAGKMHAPDDLLLYKLRGMSEAELRNLPDVTEGLERRVLRHAVTASGREDLLDALKCKRYTRARLSRLLAHALLGMTGDLIRRHPEPEYLRLLGMRDDARPLLRELKRRAAKPIVSDPTQLTNSEVFQLECRATDLRALQCDAPEDRQSGQEFTRKFVRV